VSAYGGTIIRQRSGNPSHSKCRSGAKTARAPANSSPSRRSGMAETHPAAPRNLVRKSVWDSLWLPVDSLPAFPSGFHRSSTRAFYSLFNLFLCRLTRHDSSSPLHAKHCHAPCPFYPSPPSLALTSVGYRHSPLHCSESADAAFSLFLS
jgi:hypothetical protein